MLFGAAFYECVAESTEPGSLARRENTQSSCLGLVLDTLIAWGTAR
jgi:hypothetical protein